MSSMDKMWASFVAIGLMVFASLLITFARYKFEKGIVRLLLSIIAFFLLAVSVLYMVFSL